jgi:hypothetical protein
MGQVNKEWHEKNKMPKNPSHEQKMNWHIDHSKNCSCYPISEKLQKEMDEFGKEENEKMA